MAEDVKTLDQLEQRFHIDGPHSDDDVRTAAAAIAHLVRYLNHATLPERAGRTLEFPSTVSRVVDNLHTATARMDQLAGQLADRLEAFAGDDRLYDDGMGRPLEQGGGAPVRARLAASKLRTAAAESAHTSAMFGEVFSHTDRLGVRD